MATKKRRKTTRKRRKQRHPNLGGARPGSGRKPVGLRAGVSHRARPRFTSRDYVHVTFRVLAELPDLQSTAVTEAMAECIDDAPSAPGFRIERFSIRSDHVHLIVKARSRPMLATAMQGMGVRLARKLNAMWDRKGTIFADRYDATVLSTAAELEKVLACVRSARCGMRGAQRCPAARAVPKPKPRKKKGKLTSKRKVARKRPAQKSRPRTAS